MHFFQLSRLLSAAKTAFGTSTLTRSRRTRRMSVPGTESLEAREVLTGSFVSAHTISGFESSLREVTTDSAGNVYYAGTFAGSVDADPGKESTTITAVGGRDFFVSKISVSGDLLWVRQINSSAVDTGVNAVKGLEIDSNGNLFLVGNFHGALSVPGDKGDTVVLTASETSAGFVVRLNSTGVAEAFLKLGDGGLSTVAAASTLDIDDNLIVAGGFRGIIDVDPGPGISSLNSAAGVPGSSVIPESGFAVKLSAGGDIIWGRALNGFNEDGFVRYNTLTSDTSGNAILAGAFNGIADFDPGPQQWTRAGIAAAAGFIQVLNQDGRFVSEQVIQPAIHPSGVPSEVQIDQVAVRPEGNLVIGGSFVGAADFDPGIASSIHLSSGARTGFLQELDTVGRISWQRFFPFSNSSAVSALNLDATGSVIAGVFVDGAVLVDASGVAVSLPNNASGYSGTLVLRLNETGQTVWSRTFAARSDAMAILPGGDAVFVGRYQSTFDADPGTGTFTVQASALPTGFAVRLSQHLRYSSSRTSDLIVRRVGDSIEIAHRLTRRRYAIAPISEIFGVTIDAASTQTDRITLDFQSLGSLSLRDGISILNADGDDQLVLTGSAAQTAVYSPMPTASRSGDLAVDGLPIHFYSTESVRVSGFGSLAVAPLGSRDVLEVAGSMTGVFPAGLISGTTDGMPVSPLYFDSVPRVRIDTSLHDLLPSTSGDTITLNPDSLNAFGLQSMLLSTGMGNDTVSFFGGDLSFPVSGGTFSWDGGAGRDRLNVTGSADWTLDDHRIESSEGGILTFQSIETSSVTGGSGDDRIDASAFSGNVIIDGSSGNDVLLGGSGHDLIYAGVGHDVIYGNDGNDSLYGQDGDDTIWAGNGNDWVWGGARNDRLYGGDGNDWIDGNIGNDVIFGQDGDDLLRGNSGNDSINGGVGDDELLGMDGNDYLTGGDGDDILLGGNDNDRLIGGSGNDTLTGEAGADFYQFEGSLESDRIRIVSRTLNSATFIRQPRRLGTLLESDAITFDTTDEFSINALSGDDLIEIDLSFSLFGTVDGGDGTDICSSGPNVDVTNC